MARGKRKGGRTRPQRTEQEQQAAAGEYREAVDAFQRSAFWNLRTRIANVGIVIGALALLAVVLGSADGARLSPTLLCVLGGVCGAAVYFSRPYPSMVKYLLIASVGFLVLGILGLVLVVQVLGR
ncbi:hypothetical protein [Couchioplanes caeruleus]|nr:hypothetical protein [Couchioplanes caeruleus]